MATYGFQGYFQKNRWFGVLQGPDLRATQSIGYANLEGAGGVVTQLTNKQTGVTLNTSNGLITMNNEALGADAITSFTLTSDKIRDTDLIMLQHNSAGTVGAYVLSAQPAEGSAVINVANRTTGSLSEAIVLRFMRFVGASS